MACQVPPSERHGHPGDMGSIEPVGGAGLFSLWSAWV